MKILIPESVSMMLKNWKRRGRKNISAKTTLLSFWSFRIILLILAVLFIVATYKINSLINTSLIKPVSKIEKLAEPSPPSSTEARVTKEDKETLSTTNTGFAFSVLSLMLLTIITTTIVEGKKARSSWGKILSQPVFAAMAAIVAISAMLSLFYYPAWQWIWSNQTLFWGTCMGLIIYAYFRTKEGKYNRYIANMILLLIFIGFFVCIPTDYRWGWSKDENTGFKKTANIPSGEAPTEVVFPIIAECESGGRQFNDDGTVVRGKKDPDDIGYLQINQRIHADLIKEHPEVNIFLSKKDNVRFGEILHEQEGYEPWNSSRACWEPKLSARGYNPQTLLGKMYTFEAPAGDFGAEKKIPKGVYFDWGSSSGAFIVKDQKGDIAQFDLDNGIIENLPYPSSRLWFKSLREEPQIVRLELSNTPLVKM